MNLKPIIALGMQIAEEGVKQLARISDDPEGVGRRAAECYNELASTLPIPLPQIPLSPQPDETSARPNHWHASHGDKVQRRPSTEGPVISTATTHKQEANPQSLATPVTARSGAQSSPSKKRKPTKPKATAKKRGRKKSATPGLLADGQLQAESTLMKLSKKDLQTLCRLRKVRYTKSAPKQELIAALHSSPV